MYKFIFEKLKQYLLLMRVDKPIGTLLLAYPVLWSLWISGNGEPRADYVFIFLLGAFITRSAGCVINDFADRNIDLLVKRTTERPVTSGKVSAKEAMGLFVCLALIAFSFLIWLPLAVIPCALLSLVLGVVYPFVKRFFVIPQLVLGAAYSSSILMVFVAVTGSLSWVAIVIFLANTVWTVLFDTYYAMVDQDDDIKINVHSSAIFFADKTVLVIDLLIAAFLILMIAVGLMTELGGYYYLGLILAFACFMYQKQISKSKQRQDYFTAFLNNQWVGMFVFIGVLLSYLPKA